MSGKFIEPMLALVVTKLPEGQAWSTNSNSTVYRAVGLKALRARLTQTRRTRSVRCEK
jgi:hypothetical protein